MITTDDLDALDREAEEAAATLAELEARPAGDDVVVSQGVKARRAQVAAQRLRARYDEQQAALAAREKAEKAAAKDARAAAQGLAAARDRATAAVVEAETAMVAALHAVADYDAAVREASGELVATGLPARFLDIDRPLGGDRGGVRIDGEWWPAVEPGAVLAWSAHRVVRAVLGDRHGLALRLARFAGTERIAERPDGLLDGVPPLPAKVTPPRVPADVEEALRSQQEAARERYETDGKPFLLTESGRR